MSLAEEEETIKAESKGGHEVKFEPHEAILRTMQDLSNRNLALPLSHFWSCKVFYYLKIT